MPPTDRRDRLDDPARWSVALTPRLERLRGERGLAQLLRRGGLSPRQRLVLLGGGSDRIETRRALARARVGDGRGPLIPLSERPVEVAPEPAPAPVPAPPPAPAAPPAERPWEGDPVAQAEALRRASESGAPFCALCERARARSTWRGDAVAQAAALRAASARAAPFCAECEAAKARAAG